MKLQDYRQLFYDQAKKTSDVVRNLAFVGVAIIWVFKKETDTGQIIISATFSYAGVFLIISFILDLLHCVIPTIIWDYFHKTKEKEKGVDENTEIDHPSWMSKPAYFFFWSKISFVIIAYGLIFKEILDRVTL